MTNLNIQNGNNINLTFLEANNNPSLFCIEVDDPTFMDNNFLGYIDSWASFNLNCSCTNPTAPTGISGLTSICNGANTTLSANGGLDGSGAIYEWGTGAIGSNIIVGQNASTITVSPSINTTYWVRRVGTVPPCTNNTAGVTQLVTVTPTAVPSLNISANPGNTICNGTSVTFTATPVNGGAAPAYQWKLNGANVGSNSATYTNASLSNGNTIQCVLTSNANCASPLTANSNTVTMVVSSTLTPSVSISANPGNNICNGTSVTFTAVPTNGGTTPAYQWKLNGTNVGTNSSTYINAGLVNGDAITCVLTSNDPCASPLTANSNTVTMVVSSTLTPSVSISANPGNNICVGTSVTFTAVPTNGGATPAYQWKLNGANVGANSTTYTNAGLVNGDAITCVLTSNDPCASPLSANSNTLNMIVNGLVTPSVNISANPGATICNGTSVTFTATPVNGGAAPAYQWKLNGANVGSNSATYTNASLNNADAIQCVLTSNANCASPLTANSNTLNMTVNAIVTPSVNIVANPGNTICNGTSVTFTATPVNGGAAPSYQWKLNGINVGSNSTTYTNTSLNNADDIQCILTSNANCASPLTANSNTINMTVNSSVTPSVNISANPGNTICNGTSVTFTATPVNAGAAPTYQWQVNGVNVGTNSNTYTSTTLSNNNVVSCILTSNANCASPTQVGSNNINMLVNPNLTPSVTISATSTTVCSGSTIDFTANTTNGGLTPAYQWQVNGINVGTNASTYSTASLLNNDVITCILTSNETCLTTANATSNSITMTNGNVTPTVTINASQTNVCEGTSITFSASTTDGGTLPVYQWQVNGIDVGSNLPTYTSTNLADNDVVQCILTSNALCITTNTVNSNNIQITIIAAVIPTVSITANPGVSICSAVPVTFTANPVNGGTPNYQWKLNGFNVGTNSNSYTTNTLNDNDIVTCEMTSNANCANPVLVTSNSLTISVTGNVIPSIIISSANGNTICEGTSVTLNANVQNEGVAPQFEWMINGNISGNNSNTFTTNTLLNGDVVQCILTSSLACASPITASSNNIGFIVNPNLNSSLTINASQNTICAGTAVYFTTSVQNGGSQPAFQWQLNGINVGSNSPFYSASNFNNNDVVSCWLISNEACVVQNPSNSNDINITVNNNVFSPNFLADQTVLTQIPFTVNFTNTTPNQGSYVYQWYFGDGSTSTDASPLHQFNSSGTYTVALQAKDNQTGCVDEIIKNDYIICSNGSSNCNYSNTLNYTGIVNGCIGGYLDLSVSTTATNPTYQWVRDGVYIGGATQSTFHANVSGSYSVIVYNNGGCAVPSSYTQVSFSGTAPVLPTINQTGNLNPCVPSVVTLEANAPGANSFLWNTGSTNSTINVSQSGYYTVTAFFGVGCQASSLPLPLSGSLAPNPGICLVTVDSATNNNLIVWETPNSTNIDSIFIYKETSNLNIFQKIGSVGYNDLSEFIDGSSNTQIQGYRYQIVVLDTCGGITLPSYAHKTIHLQINPGVNNNRELSWSAYEGTNFVAYEIWRKIPGDIFQLLTTVPASQNIYTDNNPISLDADYKIEIVLAQTCNSIDRAAYGKSKSNVGNNQAILLVPDGIEDKNLLANVKILPNPSNGNTMLQWESSKAQNLQIVVTDVIGKVVIANNVNAQKGNNSYNITVDAAGVYFVTIFNANGSKNVLKMVVR
ncbi:MAG TPA: PKD domain-containing protein [Bacteroidia bacterium]|nr:PKD domain-containing protein [Bacteroidia bacterium]